VAGRFVLYLVAMVYAAEVAAVHQRRSVRDRADGLGAECVDRPA
jgi:hypothetical protein